MSWTEEILSMLGAGFPLVQLVSYEETRVERELADAAEAAGVQLVSTSTTADPLETLVQAESHEGPCIVLVKDLHPHFSNHQVIRRIRDLVPLLSDRRVLLALLSPLPELPTELVHDAVMVDVPLPDLGMLERLAGAAAQKAGAGDAQVGEVASALRGLTLEEARRVLAKLLVVHGVGALESPARVLEEKKRLVRTVGALTIVEPDRSLDDLGGADELKRWLDERTRAFSEEARQFGLPAPRGLLLAGVQGCGKSLASRAIASYWSLPLARLDMGLLMGLASPEAALHEVFKVVEAMSPAVLWIDEIEKVLQVDMRGAAGRILGSFVTWLSEKQTPVFTVATANDVDLLPAELARKGRFDEIFFFDLPDGRDRAEIFSIHLEQRGSDPSTFDTEALASSTDHYSGSEIEQVVVGALYRAFAAGRPLEARDLQVAVSETVPLYKTYEERIKALREWARGRARPAALERRRLDLFEKE
ncbi:MAG: AAA family ATPase [Deltaproteobacteria bacterium]|nr:AAA family ATPase [Deltaproteobacteria bacterium]